MDDVVEVELSKIVIQHKHEEQFIHLRELGGERSFAIVIGDNEAFEIRRKVARDGSARPLTHDLIGRVLAAFEAELERVVVTALRDRTYFASLEIRTEGGDVVSIDCRPSDAIALAAQKRCPVFVARAVLDKVAPGPG